MKTPEFVNSVARKTKMSETDAERMAHAFLQTLSERLTPKEAKDLAAQLPNGLSETVRKMHTGEVKPYTADEFIKLFALRHDCGRAESERHAKAIWETLTEAVSAGEIDRVRTELSRDYERLFGASRFAELTRA